MILMKEAYAFFGYMRIERSAGVFVSDGVDLLQLYADGEKGILEATSWLQGLQPGR